MKKFYSFLLMLLFVNTLYAGSFDWYRQVQLSLRKHVATGIATDFQLNTVVSGGFRPCLNCSEVGFLACYDSLSVPRWSMTASSFGATNVRFSQPFYDNNGFLYTSIYIPPNTLFGPQLNVGTAWIGGPDTSGYVVLFRFTPDGTLDWHQVVATSQAVVHCADTSGNTYFSNGDTTWRFNPAGVQDWMNTGKGGTILSVTGNDVYTGNGVLLHRLSATNGLFKSTWTLPAYTDIETASGGIVFGTGAQGTFKARNGVLLFQKSSLAGVGISKRGSDLWILENHPAAGGMSGTVLFKKLSSASGAVLETQSINEAETCGTAGNLAIDASGSLLVTFNGFDGAPYSYYKLSPYIVWRDYMNYESVFLVKYRTKNLSPVLGFSNSVWTNGEFGVDGWNAADVGAAKPCSGVQGFYVGYHLLNDTLLPGNVVMVELSDSTGDFTNPLVIGSKATTWEKSTVYCDIPFTLPNGPDYRIRIKTTNPALTGIQESYPLGIYAPKSILSGNGPLTFCKGTAGTEIICTSNDPLNTYAWERNGSKSTELTGDTVSPVKSGTYFALVTDPDGCERRSDNSILITVLPLPQAVLNAPGTNIICKDSSIELQVNAATAVSYQWLRNNVPVSGANGSVFTTGLAGTYKVVVTDANACSKNSSNSKVSIYSAAISSETPLSFCDGDSVVLHGPVSNTLSYQWQLNGMDLPGATNVSYVAKIGGSYTVVTTSTAGCTALSPSSVVSIVCRSSNTVKPELLVYPNPARDRVYVDPGVFEEGAMLELRDAGGRLLYSTKTHTGEHVLKIDLDAFAPGVYLLRFISRDAFQKSVRVTKF